MSNKSPFVTPLCDQKTVNAGAVLQSPPSLIHSLTDPLVYNLRTLSIPNRKSWQADILRECSLPPCVTCHMSYVMCHMSHIICHNSHVTCHMSRATCHTSICFIWQSAVANRWRVWVQCTVYSLQFTVYSLHYIAHSVQYTVYSIQCTVYNLQCTIYTI